MFPATLYPLPSPAPILRHPRSHGVFLLGVEYASGKLIPVEEKSRHAPRTFAGWPARSLVGIVLLSGASFLDPPTMYPIEMVTPPPELLTESAYMVNSSFYHPESLIYRFPGKRFIGMPLDPVQFEDFRTRYPAFSAVLWHDFIVHDELLRYFLNGGGYEVSGAGSNLLGRKYVVLSLRDSRKLIDTTTPPTGP